METHHSSVYKYFEFLKEEKIKKDKGNEQINQVYKCLVCLRLGKKDKDSEFKLIRCLKGVS